MVFFDIRVCPMCSKSNRIPAQYLARVARCGACRASLPARSEPLDVDATAFDAVTRNATVPVLVDFWAPWCPPCRMVAPHVKEIAHELAGRALVLKVDTEKHPGLSARFGISAIPTFALFVGGRLVRQQSGAIAKAEMRRWFDDTASTRA